MVSRDSYSPALLASHSYPYHSQNWGPDTLLRTATVLTPDVTVVFLQWTISRDDTSFRALQDSFNSSQTPLLSLKVGFKGLFVGPFVCISFVIKGLNVKIRHSIFFCANMCSFGQLFEKVNSFDAHWNFIAAWLPSIYTPSHSTPWPVQVMSGIS